MALPLIIGALAPILGKVIDNAIPDKAKAAELQIELAKLADAGAQRDHEAAIAQVEVNKVEAAHANIFVSGWRPFLGWLGGVGLGMIYIVQPAVQLWRGEPVSLDTSELMVLLGGLLGFGTMRSFDKLKGTAHLPKPVEPSKLPQGSTLPANAPIMGQGRKLVL